MSNAITISGSQYTVQGTVKNKADDKGIADLHVLVYDKDLVFDDFLGVGVTNDKGSFSVSFDSSKFKGFLEGNPDLYFIVKDAGLELLNTKENVLKGKNKTGSRQRVQQGGI